MNLAYEKIDDFGIHINLQDSFLSTPFRVSSGIPKPESYGSPEGKKTTCGACGSIHHTFYDRKIRRVRDLSCGDMREVYPTFAQRESEHRGAGGVKDAVKSEQAIKHCLSPKGILQPALGI